MSVQSSDSSQVSDIAITSNGDSNSFNRFSIFLKFVELEISTIVLQISPNELEISPIELEISTNTVYLQISPIEL